MLGEATYQALPSPMNVLQLCSKSREYQVARYAQEHWIHSSIYAIEVMQQLLSHHHQAKILQSMLKMLRYRPSSHKSRVLLKSS